MVLIGSDHIVKFITLKLLIPFGAGSPELRRVENQFGAFFHKPSSVSYDLPVQMRRISNIRGDMDLDDARPHPNQPGAVCVVRNPGGGDLFACIGTFPGKLRALESVSLCLLARTRQA